MSDILYDASGIARSQKIRKSAIAAVLLCAVSIIMLIGAQHLLVNGDFAVSDIDGFFKIDVLSKAFNILYFVLLVSSLTFSVFGINKMWQAIEYAKDIIESNRYHRDSVIEDIDYSNDFPQMYKKGEQNGRR